MEPKVHKQANPGAGHARAERERREQRLAELARQQHGIVSRGQLLDLGVGAEAIKARLRLGRLHGVHRGVYAVGHRRSTIRSMWLAAVFAYGQEAVLSHWSAAALWGLARPRWSPIDVTSPRGRPGRPGIRLHHSPLRAVDRTIEAAIPTTSVPRTLLDLAGITTAERLRQAFEEADRLKLLSMRDLEQVCARAGRRKGLATLRSLIAASREPMAGRSPLENRFGKFCQKHLSDLPLPQTNVLVLGHEVDAYWPHRRLAVEMDSWEFHHHRAAFESDRARDARMQASGYRVVRLTHRRLEADPERVASELRRMLSDSSPAES